ncbi:MAG: hypothetical protein AAB225_14600 [Acidobacteriota bacterium]
MRKRVLVAYRPRLMRDLVTALVAEQSDLEVVGELYDEKDLVAAVEALAPDVLVVGLDESNQISPACALLLARRPHLKIVGLADGRDNSFYFWADVDVRSRPIENSERGLLGAIRCKRNDSLFSAAADSKRPN